MAKLMPLNYWADSGDFVSWRASSAVATFFEARS
jgi:hypothetical protein